MRGRWWGRDWTVCWGPGHEGCVDMPTVECQQQYLGQVVRKSIFQILWNDLQCGGWIKRRTQSQNSIFQDKRAWARAMTQNKRRGHSQEIFAGRISGLENDYYVNDRKEEIKICKGIAEQWFHLQADRHWAMLDQGGRSRLMTMMVFCTSRLFSSFCQCLSPYWRFYISNISCYQSWNTRNHKNKEADRTGKTGKVQTGKRTHPK